MRAPLALLPLVLALLTACSSSHDRDDCPEVLGACSDRCCTATVEPTFDGECNATCPAGTTLVDRCAPAADCGGPDAGCPDAGLGPPAPCFTGVCCDERVDWVVSGCGLACPAGSSSDCQVAPGAICAPPWLASCATPADCRLTPTDCCEPCAEPALEAFSPVHVDGYEAWRATTCPEPVACDACAPVPYPHFVATCNEASMCEVLDVRTHPVTACAEDTDCRLRVPECCECGATVDPDGLIAIHVDQGGEYAALVCDPGDPSCRPCGAVYPTDREAFCDAGRCAVRAVP